MSRFACWWLVVLVAGSFGLGSASTEEPAKKALTKRAIGGKISKDDPKDKATRAPGQVHEFKLTKDKSYQFELFSNQFDAYLRVEDASGGQLVEDNDSGGNQNARLRLFVDADGTYRVFVSSIGGGEGAYTLFIGECAAPTPLDPFKPGKTATVKSELTKLDDPDPFRHAPAKIYAVELEASKVYEFDIASTSFDPFLRVVGQNGRLLVINNKTSRIHFLAPAAGRYHVVATTFDLKVGPFELRAGIAEGAAPKTFTVKDLPAGRTIELPGVLTFSEKPLAHSWGGPAVMHTFEMEPGLVYEFEMIATKFEPYLQLVDAEDRVVAQDRNSGVRRTPRIRFTPSTRGAYRLVGITQSGKVGPYELYARCLGKSERPDPNVTLAIPKGGYAYQGRLLPEDPADRVNQRSRAHVFSLKLSSGKSYVIALSSKDFDAQLRVEDSQGAELARDDDSGPGFDALLTFSPPTDGVYRIVATTAELDLGKYVLKVTER